MYRAEVDPDVVAVAVVGIDSDMEAIADGLGGAICLVVTDTAIPDTASD